MASHKAFVGVRRPCRCSFARQSIVVGRGSSFRALRYFQHPEGFFRNRINRRYSTQSIKWYVGGFALFHFEVESFGRAVKTEVVAAGEHEDILWEGVTLGAGLWLVHYERI